METVAFLIGRCTCLDLRISARFTISGVYLMIYLRLKTWQYVSIIFASDGRCEHYRRYQGSTGRLKIEP